MSVRAYVLLAILLAIIIAGFSYLRILASRIFVEAWPHREEAVRARLNEVTLQPASAPSQSVTLFFPSQEKRELVAEKRPMPLAATETDRIRQLLLALIEGSRLGYGRVLPPSAEVRAVFLTSDGLAFVDFSNDFLSNFNPGITAETLTLYSIVNTLTLNIPTVKKVKFLIQGQEVDTLDGHADLSGYYAPDTALVGPSS